MPMIALYNDNSSPPHGRTAYKTLPCCGCGTRQRVCFSATRCLCHACLAAGRTLPSAKDYDMPDFIHPADTTIRASVRTSQ